MCNASNFLYEREFSIQHIMGCGSARSGCDGGYAHQGYLALMDGVALERDVPYLCEGEGTLSCQQWPWGTAVPQACDATSQFVSVDSFFRLPLQGSVADRVAAMATELSSNGPLAVDFCVRDNFFDFWSTDKNRIYTDADGCKHGATVGGHMAVVVGFSSAVDASGGETPYWTLLNSWSDSWADDGYFYMERGVNLCGVENKASAVNVTVWPDRTMLGTTLPIQNASFRDVEVTETEDDIGIRVPLGTFLIVVCSLVVLLAIVCVVVLLLWLRHRDLRKIVRSQRPNFVPVPDIPRQPFRDAHYEVHESTGTEPSVVGQPSQTPFV